MHNTLISNYTLKGSTTNWRLTDMKVTLEIHWTILGMEVITAHFPRTTSKLKRTHRTKDKYTDLVYEIFNNNFFSNLRDNDRSSLNCASMLKGGWWWKSCGRGLNGLYLNDPQDLTARQGMKRSNLFSSKTK